MKKFRLILLMICLFIPFLVVGCKEEEPPMSTPQNVSVKNGMIVFDAVQDAQYYNLNINDLSFDVYVNRNSNIQEQDGKVKYNANAMMEFGKTYEIKIKACHTERGHSEYSDVLSYVHISDLNKISSTYVNSHTLTWGEVLNATEYEIKVVTPLDKVLVDESGNVLTGATEEIIEMAQLPVYRATDNKFNFSSFLTTAGEYSFYARAKYYNTENESYGEYAKLGTYEHFIKINTPQIIGIGRIENDLYLSAVIDTNANQISITCGEYSLTENILENENVYQEGNLVRVNLSKTFGPANFQNGYLSFSKAQEYLFSIKTKREDGAIKNYYLDSEESAPKGYMNHVEILAPTNITLSYDNLNQTYVASWNKSTTDENLVVGYKVYVVTSTALREYMVNSSTFNYLVGNDVLAVAVSAIGPTNYYKSTISQFVNNSTLTSSISGFNPSVVDNNRIVFNGGADYYIVVVNNQIYSTYTTYFSVEHTMAKLKQENVKVIAVKEGFKIAQTEMMVDVQKVLETPTVVDNKQANYNTTIHLTPISNAIGYYVYVSKSGASYIKIDELFTSPTINLKDYILPNTEYKIKVQAVADIYGRYSNSDLSKLIEIKTPKKLELPKWKTVEGEIKPILEEDGNKYLCFYGVENATSYELIIDYNLKTIMPGIADENGMFKINITEYLKSAGNIVIKVKALTYADGFASSDYIEYMITQTKQLEQVQNLKLSQLNGVFSLTFDSVDNASVYKVMLTNPNGDIHTFEITSTSYDVTEYIQGTGMCSVLVTACSNNDHYLDSPVARLVVQIN